MLTDTAAKADREAELRLYASLASYEGLDPATVSQRPVTAHIRALMPGILLAGMISMAAAFISDHYGAPVMLIAMLLGMSFNFLAVEPVVAPGLDVASKTLLRTGVALLGVRISLDQVSSLGGSTILLVLGAVLATIAFGRIAAHFMRLTPEIGYLSGGAVAICGASAALALASAMPRSPTLERSTSLAVVGVTALSSIAMILYPPLFLALGLGHHEIGIVLGATIHDVAQVVAAGYMVSPDAGATATVVKLLRVAMLAPVVIVVGVLLCPKSHGRLRGYAPPWFLVAFCVLVGINSLGFIGARFAALLVSTSQWALIIAIAAIGIKSSFRVLFTLGWKPAALMVGETVFLALLIVLALPLVRH